MDPIGPVSCGESAIHPLEWWRPLRASVRGQYCISTKLKQNIKEQASRSNKLWGLGVGSKGEERFYDDTGLLA